LDRIRAEGDAFAIGHRLGVHARESIHGMLPRVAEFAALAHWRGTPRLEAMQAAVAHGFPRYLRELEGLAAGAGFDFAHLFAWNCRGDLRFAAGSDRAARMAEAAGCTTVLLAADEAAGLPAVIGHNEDGEPEMAGHCFLLDAVPDEGQAFTSFCYPGLLPGHTFAVNGASLVQTINNIAPDDLRVGLPRHFVSRAVLDCDSLDAALRLLARDDRAGGFHHNLAQAGDPRLLSVEAPAGGCQLHQVEATYAHANHLISEPFADQPQCATPSSLSRQARAEALIAAGALAARDPGAVLFDSAAALPIHRRGRNPEDSGYTVATGVFEIHPDRVDWRAMVDPAGPPCHEGSVAPRPAR
jgi:hypothetical protein